MLSLIVLFPDGPNTQHPKSQSLEVSGDESSSPEIHRFKRFERAK
jgi:hypothetical protein